MQVTSISRARPRTNRSSQQYTRIQGGKLFAQFVLTKMAIWLEYERLGLLTPVRHCIPFSTRRCGF